MRIGLTELFVIVIVILALISPDKLIEYAGKAGKLIKKVSEEKENIKEPINDALEPVVDAKKDVEDIVNSVKDTFTLN